MTLKYVAFALLAYILGSIPFSYIIPRVTKGIDIREHGSGNVGSSNVSRVCGKGAGIVALSFDVGKGAAAVFLCSIAGTPLILGCFAILGHITTPFLKFSGGKGIATSIGVFAMFSWKVGLIVAGIWIIVTVLWRIAAISSLLAVSAAPPLFLLFSGEKMVLYASVGIALLAFFTHRENIKRLIGGEENKI